MKELTLDEVKRVQINILDVIDKFCNDNNIKYSLGYGTLIGAVRHKGYIPWDDDIDLCMMREDYEKFVSTFNGNFENYRVLDYRSSSYFDCPFAKVEDINTILKEDAFYKKQIGINVDVFVIDGIPEDRELQAKFFKYVNRLARMIYYKKAPLSLKHKTFIKLIALCLIKLMYMPFPLRTIFNKLHKLSYGKWDDSKYVYTVGEQFAFKRFYFESMTTVEFEGKKYSAMGGYDGCLRAQFGDYMKLPPVEHRVSPHHFKAYQK